MTARNHIQSGLIISEITVVNEVKRHRGNAGLVIGKITVI